MSRQLIRWVHVPDETGAMVAFGPGDDVPEWAAVQITGTKAWAPEGDPQGPVPASLVEHASKASPLASPAAPPGGPLERPPMSGAGSDTKSWIAYARSVGVTVSDDAPRGDVIEAVEAVQPSK